MKNKKTLFVSAFIITAMLTGKTNALAEEGWTRSDGDWRYLDSNNTAVSDTWKQSNDSWYYLDVNGRILKQTLLDRNGSVYYLDESGKKVVNNWVYLEQETDGHQTGWYYFDAGGKALKKSDSTVKKKVGEFYYAFGEDGHMLTGWIDQDGQELSDDENVIEEGIYYADEKGRLMAGKWLNYSALQETRNLLESKITERNYDEYGEIWFYFDETCKKVKSNNDVLRQKVIDGETYGFDENGVMNTWWGGIASISNADKSNPTTEKPTKYFSGYDGGKLFKNTWFWMFPSEGLDEVEYDQGECSWWYTNEKGEAYQNKIKTINGREYAFDGLGRMKTGFVLFNGRSEYVAQYDVNTWSSKDFAEGNIYGIEKADLYLFSPDEINDGSMQMGREIKVELDDGIFTFGFASNGKAFGNRNQLQKKDNSYYINGLRLEGDENWGFGVVRSEYGDRETYQVVDQRGIVVKGKKKILTDKNGGYLLIIDNCFAAYVEDENKPRWRTGTEGTGYYRYDKSNKENPYEGGLIAGADLDVSTDQLPDELKLNFD